MAKSADKLLIVLVTVSSRREAEKIGQAVVKEKLSACVNIVPAVTSIFRWQGKIQKSRERLLMVKTTGHRYAALEKLIRSMHSYEVPEIIAVKVDRGLNQYIAWIEQVTTRD